jgi:hypothetical protein
MHCTTCTPATPSPPIGSLRPRLGTLKWRTAAEVKENVFTFFSSGIGGPHEYKGQDMVVAHENMAKQMPITEAAFHALTCAPAALIVLRVLAQPRDWRWRCSAGAMQS